MEGLFYEKNTKSQLFFCIVNFLETNKNFGMYYIKIRLLCGYFSFETAKSNDKKKSK